MRYQRSCRRLARLAALSLFLLLLIMLMRRVVHNNPSPSRLITGDYWQTYTREQVRQMDTIDWHDRRQEKRDAARTGPGEHGVAYTVGAEFKLQRSQLYKVNGFNGFASDQISLNRSVPDIRHKKCDSRRYLRHLPTVSVVVPFHNEHLSTLLRTASSLVYRAPAHLLREVILVDDASTKNHTRFPLFDRLLLRMFGGVVRVLHLARRSGLITARLAGANITIADVIVFVDSHCEASVNWLPPLLEPIAKNYRTCVCPFIDVIDYENFEYRAQDEGKRGAFNWEFLYDRLDLLPRDIENMPEPFPSPVMTGGLFAISRKFFFELGGYDPELEIWGGEQYELSFKVWMCGGQMLDAPCSRIGHIYRLFPPFRNTRTNDFLAKNYRRVAEVWMDDYAQYVYQRRPHYLRTQPGDLSQRRAIRQRLKCHNFQWFLDNVAFDLTAKYPPIEPDDLAHGQVRSAVNDSVCVDSLFGSQSSSLALRPCMQAGTTSAEQQFHLTWRSDIHCGTRDMCWDLPSADPIKRHSSVLLWSCHTMKGNQWWIYDPSKQWIVHHNTRFCLDADLAKTEVFSSPCDEQVPTQRWIFEHFNTSALAAVAY